MAKIEDRIAKLKKETGGKKKYEKIKLRVG
jgi:hypothetical protein